MTAAMSPPLSVQRRAGPVQGQIRLGRNALSGRALSFLAAAVLGLLFSINLTELLGGGQNPGADTSGGGPSRFAYIALYGIIGLLLIPLRRRAIGLAVSSPLLVLTLAWALISMQWSVAPGETFERWVSLFGTSLLGLYLCAALSYTDFLRAQMAALAVGLGLSLIVAVAIPAIGVTQEGFWQGAWKGLYVHKNTLGRMAAICLVLSTLLAFRRAPERMIYVACVPLCLLLIFFSQSTTALMSGAGGLIFLAMARMFQVSVNRAVILAMPLAGLGLLIMIGLIAYGGFGELLGLLGKEGTLTGRLPLWSEAWSFVRERPLLGYGAQAFWVETHTATQIIENALGFRPPHAHNALIEIWLSLGGVGVALTAALLGLAFVKAARLARSGRDIALLWPLVFLFFILANNLTETTLFVRNEFSWVQVVGVILLLNKRFPIILRGHAGQTAYRRG